MASSGAKADGCARVFTVGPVPLFLGRDTGRIASQVKFLDVMIVHPFPVGFYPCRTAIPADVSLIPQACEETLLFFNVAHTTDEPFGESPLLFFNLYEESEDHVCPPPVTLSVETVQEDEEPKPVLFFVLYEADEDC